LVAWQIGRKIENFLVGVHWWIGAIDFI